MSLSRIGSLFIAALMLYTVALVASQDLPECVYEAFPELNRTTSEVTSAKSYYNFKTNEGLVCETCVIFMTAIEDALLDPNIEDMVCCNVFSSMMFQKFPILFLWNFEQNWAKGFWENWKRVSAVC